MFRKLKHIVQFIKRGIINIIYQDDHFVHIQGEIKDIKKAIKFECAKKQLEYSFLQGNITLNDIDHIGRRIIVSLTTHGSRIHSVFRTIESIFQQTLKPNKIILWLGNNEYSHIQELPISIKKLMKRGLDVRFVNDVRSYTKLIPAIKQFPDAYIITIDDDILYPHDLIERLVSSSKKHPNAVCCVAMRPLQIKNNKVIKPYRSHELVTKVISDESYFYIAEGFAGILYPPHSLPQEALDDSVFLKLAPNADDIWFRVMELINGTKLVTAGYEEPLWDFILVDESSQDIGLFKENIYNNKNDEQLKNVLEHYNLFEKLQLTR